MSQSNKISIKEALVPTLEEIERCITFEGPPYFSGYKELDEETGGVVTPGELTLIAAPLEIEKLDFSLNILMYFVKSCENRSALLFNPIMNNHTVMKRLISSGGLIEIGKLHSGDLDEDEQDRLMQVSRFLHGIDDRIIMSNENSIESVKLNVEAAAKNCREILVIINEVGTIAGKDVLGDLKRLAMKLNICIVAVKSLSKDPALNRPDKRPKLSDLPDADRIPADKVLFVYTDVAYHPESEHAGKAELILAKNNCGPTGTVFLAHQPEYCSFFNILKEEDK